MHGFSLVGEEASEEGVESVGDLEFFSGAAGFGFGAACDPVAPGAHDEPVER